MPNDDAQTRDGRFRVDLGAWQTMVVRMVEKIEKRIDDHEDECRDERQRAQASRESLRKELLDKMDSSETEIKNVFKEAHTENKASIAGVAEAASKGANKMMMWALSGAGALIMVLLTVIAFFVAPYFQH